MKQALSTAKIVVLFAFIVTFPLFFLPFTSEFFTTGKLYFTAGVGLLLILVSLAQFVVSKEIVWREQSLDKILALFLVACGLSIMVSSPNRVQASLSAITGFLAFASVATLAYYLSRTTRKYIELAVVIALIPLSVITILFSFKPFLNVKLPAILAFLSNPNFSPMGNQIELLIMLVVGMVFTLSSIIVWIKARNLRKKVPVLAIVATVFSGIAVGITMFQVGSIIVKNGYSSLQFPPLSISWYASVETLKQPLTALFGAGVGNFSALFSASKVPSYNFGPFWQLSSFSIARTYFLHIWAELGLLGVVASLLLVFQLVRVALMSRSLPLLALVTSVLVVFFLIPPTFTTLVLLFIVAGLTASFTHEKNNAEKEVHPTTISVARFFPVYFGIIGIVIVLIGIAGYLVGRSYQAEMAYKQSLDGALNNNIVEMYNKQREAVLLNQYIERFRIAFSQTNLLIANNMLTNLAEAQKKANEQQPQTAQQATPTISEQDRQTIAQAIQAAIAEAKAAVALNPQTSSNWENLAVIYRNIIGLAEGADAWTISAYQRAIALDPQNPIYRLNLGGLYYGFGVFDESIKLFEQTISLKSDWPNAYYNLAWGYFQKQNYQLAVQAMQTTVNLLDPKKDKADYDRSQSDLAEFIKKLPQPEATKEETKPEATKQLTLPTPPTQKVEPKIELPKEASPEAK